MKKNRVFWVVILLLALLAIVLLVTRRSGTIHPRNYRFAVEDTASITRIFMVDKENASVLLERDSSGIWMVNGKYRVRKSGIDMLLETLHKVMPKAPVPLSGRDNVIAELATQAIKVEVYQWVYRINLWDRIRLFPHEKRTSTYYVGGGTPDNRGTFMLMEGSSIPFVVHIVGFRGYIAPRYSSWEEDWRDHTVFNMRLGEIASLSIEFPETPASSFRIENRPEGLRLFSLEEEQQVAGFDTLRVMNLLTAFSDIRFETLVTTMDPRRKDSLLMATPFHIITLAGRDGEVQMMKTYHKPNDMMRLDFDGTPLPYDMDRFYGWLEEEQEFALLQFFVFDRIIRPLDFFLNI
ncbi:MAG: DUF4340 domain-containing protein [Bacteroidales bacterium]|nr:DUF4340 domain-containing protein [Bacteroidales bacterium]